MTRIRTPRIVTPRIVHPSGKGPAWLLVVALLALALWTWQVFDYGRGWAGYEALRWEQDESGLRNRVAELEEERTRLKMQLANESRAAQIDRDAVRRSQVELRELQARQSALEQELTLLRGVISRGEGPLQVRDFQLMSQPQKGRYRYSFTVAQVLKDIGDTKGSVYLLLAGKEEGERRVVKLKELTNGELAAHQMDFTHFQDFAGELSLPENFTPETLTVDLRPSNKKLRRESRVFQWKSLAGS